MDHSDSYYGQKPAAKPTKTQPCTELHLEENDDTNDDNDDHSDHSDYEQKPVAKSSKAQTNNTPQSESESSYY